MYNVVELRRSARQYGISFGTISEILAKWGPAVLKLVVDGLRGGLSLAFMQEILDTLGPLFLGSAVEHQLAKVSPPKGDFRQVGHGTYGSWDDYRCDYPDCPADEHGCDAHDCPVKVGYDGPLHTVAPIIQGQNVDDPPAPANSALIDLIIQLLPQLLQQYGQQIITWLVNLIITSLQNQKTQESLHKALQDALLSQK